MALFTAADIEMLTSKNSEKRNDWFVRDHVDDIESEFDILAHEIHTNRDRIVRMLTEKTVGLKTTYADILTIRSFDFSKVGGPFGEHMLNDIYDTYVGHAQAAFPESYMRRRLVSRYPIWKSKNFLIRLAEMLDLPANMYFVVDSLPITVESQKLFGKTNIAEYNNTLRIVYRFIK
jgi:hypothetical protein